MVGKGKKRDLQSIDWSVIILKEPPDLQQTAIDIASVVRVCSAPSEGQTFLTGIGAIERICPVLIIVGEITIPVTCTYVPLANRSQHKELR